jgi:hypothetical protein
MEEVEALANNQRLLRTSHNSHTDTINYLGQTLGQLDNTLCGGDLVAILMPETLHPAAGDESDHGDGDSQMMSLANQWLSDKAT